MNKYTFECWSETKQITVSVYAKTYKEAKEKAELFYPRATYQLSKIEEEFIEVTHENK